MLRGYWGTLVFRRTARRPRPLDSCLVFTNIKPPQLLNDVLSALKPKLLISKSFKSKFLNYP